MIFPKGLIHYQQNLDCKPVTYISSFNSEDPGVVTVSTRTFSLPNEALAVTFNVNTLDIDNIKNNLPASVAKGKIECLKKCLLKNEGIDI